MFDGIVNKAAQVEQPDDKRIYGMAVAQVVDNLDQTNQGRVQLRLSWLKGYEPWARVAVLMAGPDSGTYFIPQVGDEVLVAFNHGDVSDPYVIGSLWNGQDNPPAKQINDPVNIRMIRTPKGHKVVFDDQKKSITVKHATDGQVELTSDKIELKIGQSSITLEKNGNISIKASKEIKFEAPTINVMARDNVAISGSKSARIDGGSYCSVNASQIFIG